MPLNQDFHTFSRRSLFSIGTGAIAAGFTTNLFISNPALAAAPSPTAENVSADQALKLLLEGNQRYTSHRVTHPHQDGSRLLETSNTQNPFATILTCADSRVPPEILFDQGLGDLFVVRVAGNILDDAVLGSIEYAAEYLDVPLVMVLGHERCGAVSAALKGGTAIGHIGSLVDAIQPAIAKTKSLSGDPLDNAVRANVQMVVEQMKVSKPLVDLIGSQKLAVVGGRYDLDTGTVEIIA